MIRLIAPLPVAERGLPTNAVTQSNEFRCYPSSNCIVLENSERKAYLIHHHQSKVTAVSISPTGAWVASGDSKGQLKIWASKGENLLKYEYKLLLGVIRSIVWSPDSRRVAVCGGDPSKSGEAVCIAFDTGSRLGEVIGHTKSIACAAYRPVAPFRIITGGEDTCVIFHEGPPFKFMRSHPTVHTGFVNAVAFSPDGARAFSCASDGVVVVYAGDSGDFLSKLQPKLPCSIWGLSVLGNTTSVLALACGDKKVRIFDGQSIFSEKQVGSGELQDMPLGICGYTTPSCEFTTISLDGTLRNFSFSENNIELKATIEGSSGSIASIVPTGPGFTVSASNGSVWSVKSIDGPLHVHQTRKNPIKPSAGIATFDAESLVAINSSGTSIFVLDQEGSDLALDSPSRIMQAQSKIFILSNKSQTISEISKGAPKPLILSQYHSKLPISVLNVSRAGTSVVFSVESSNTLNSKMREFTVLKTGLSSPPMMIETEISSGDIVGLAVADGGELVAVASAGHELHVYRSGVLVPGTRNCWTYHKARITSMQWLDERFLVTAGLDRNIYVWDLADPTEGPVAALKDVHRDGVSCFHATKVSPTEVQIVSGGVEGSVVVNGLVIKRI